MKTVYRTCSTLLFCFLVLLTVRPAHALLTPIPADEAASLAAYGACRLFGGTPGDCNFLWLDPVGTDVTWVSFDLTFDTASIAIGSTPFFGCEFAASGTCVPVEVVTVGGVQSPLADFSATTAEITTPRPTASAPVFLVDNTLGTASLTWNLASNPVPGVEGAQNFFGIEVISNLGPIVGVEYFDQPGSYDLSFASFSCTTQDNSTCGSATPITGINFIVPEPSTLLLLSSGLAGLGIVGRRRDQL